MGFVAVTGAVAWVYPVILSSIKTLHPNSLCLLLVWVQAPFWAWTETEGEPEEEILSLFPIWGSTDLKSHFCCLSQVCEVQLLSLGGLLFSCKMGLDWVQQSWSLHFVQYFCRICKAVPLPYWRVYIGGRLHFPKEDKFCTSKGTWPCIFPQSEHR